MDDEKIAKIAEKASEGLLKSREPEIQRRSEEAARNIALNIAEGKVSAASENIKRELESKARDIATSVVNDAIPKIISDLNSQIESLVTNSIKDLESRIDERKSNTPSQPEDQSATNNLFNYTTRGSYEGQEVRFALNGQVLTPEEADEFGNINYIEFGGEGGGNFAFRLFPTTTGGSDPQPRIGVQYGEINGTPPSGMSQSQPLLLDCGTAKIWAEIGFNLLDGSISSRVINFGSSVPNNSISGGGANIQIGDVIFENETYTVNNQFYVGNINIRKYDICENGTPKSDYIFIGGNTPNLP